MKALINIASSISERLRLNSTIIALIKRSIAVFASSPRALSKTSRLL